MKPNFVSTHHKKRRKLDVASSFLRAFSFKTETIYIVCKKCSVAQLFACMTDELAFLVGF
jgi:hypothetical protein